MNFLRNVRRWVAPRPTPTPLTREPAPQLTSSDIALADETPVTEQDLEACLTNMRRQRQQRSATHVDFFLALQQAEKFMLECTEIGPGESHHMKTTHLDIAFRAWVVFSMRHPIDASAFRRAFLTLLEWKGGHYANHSMMLVGVKLNEDIVRIINAQEKQQDLVLVQENIHKAMSELYG